MLSYTACSPIKVAKVCKAFSQAGRPIPACAFSLDIWREMVWGGANTWQPDTSRCNRGWRPVMLSEAVDMCCVASSITCPTRDGDDRRWCSVTHSRYRRRHKGKVTVSRCARERARERECNLLILHLLQQWWPISEAIGRGLYLTQPPRTLCEVHA